MTLEKAFGEELQKAREKSGLTQEKLGFEAATTAPTSASSNAGRKARCSRQP